MNYLISGNCKFEEYNWRGVAAMLIANTGQTPR